MPPASAAGGPAEVPAAGRVTAVVCAAFDPATDAAILAVREIVRTAGVPLPPAPPHRPHLSMAAARVRRGTELDAVLAVAAQLAARHSTFPLVLGHLGRFGRAGALWLGPLSCPALADLQRDAATSLREAGWELAFGQRSEPGAWVAHCTLATRIAKPVLREVHAALHRDYRPIEARVSAVATILVGGRGDVALTPLGR